MFAKTKIELIVAHKILPRLEVLVEVEVLISTSFHSASLGLSHARREASEGR